MPVEISDWNDLDNIRNDLAADYVLVNDLDSDTDGYTGIGDDFEPIGVAVFDGDSFSGTFDGDGFAIKDLIIDIDPTESGVGLFGGISNAVVENLSVSGSLTSTFDGFNVTGGLVGFNDSSTIQNCVSHVDVTASDTNRVGGLVGSNDGTITDSYATGSVEGDDRVGGLVANNLETIETSYAVGHVTSNDEGVGGLVSLNEDTVTDSYWDTETTGQSTSDGGTGLTTSEMRGSEAETNMDGFDFADVWETVEESDDDISGDGYPVLIALDRENQLDAQVIPVEISGWNDLDNVRNELDGDYVLVNDLDSETAGYAGIGDDWTPIKSFGGSFDGQEHSISDLIVDTTDREEDTPSGFFETWDTDKDVTVKNVDILDAVVKNETETDSYSQTPEVGSGLLVGVPWDDGYANDSKRTVENCTFTGQVEGTLSGGITSAFVSDDESSITECVVDVDIESTDGCGGVAFNASSGDQIYENILVTSDLTVSGSGFRCGGFIANGGGNTKNVACFTNIDIETDVNDVGGLIADHSAVATIENCYAYGSISGTADDIGGLVGADDNTGGGTNTIENSYAAVSLENADATNLGGVIGRIEDETTITVSNAYWDEERSDISTDASDDSVALTTAEMQGSESESNMEGFDFADVWDSVVESDNDATADGYPILLVLDREQQLEGQGIFDPGPSYNIFVNDIEVQNIQVNGVDVVSIEVNGNEI